MRRARRMGRTEEDGAAFWPKATGMGRVGRGKHGSESLGLAVVTGNIRHFQRISDLSVKNWLEG